MNLLNQLKQVPHATEIFVRWLPGGEVAAPEESQSRADICNGANPTGRRCPNNMQGMSVTAPIALAVKKYLSVKNRLNLRVRGEKQLGRCAACTCELRLLIHEPQAKVSNEITDAERPLLPIFCWKLKEPT